MEITAVIREQIATLARKRGPDKTFCPSEVARSVADDWRPLMPVVRNIASELIGAGELVATQRGIVVDVQTAVGPIRLRQVSTADAS